MLQDATTVIDPWVIAEREAVSSALLNCTRIPSLFGENNLGNIIWGLDIQTRWQIASGRQQAKSSPRIDEFAWFANINYFLTVVPYLAAMNSGLLPPAQFLPPKSNAADKFPITFESIDPEIARDWTNYFETIKMLQVDATYITLENLQKLLWVVHNSTVVNAFPTFEPEIRLLNFQEEKFANGFGHFVEILAIMNVNTSYPPIYSLNQMFPQRILRLLDAPPFIFDMNFQQNVIVSAYFAINDMLQVPFMWSAFVDTLHNGMASVNCARRLQSTLNNFLSAPSGNLITLLTNAVSVLCLT